MAHKEETNTDEDRLHPHSFEGFKLLTLLGWGNFSEVYSATDDEGRNCAVKVYRSEKYFKKYFAKRKAPFPGDYMKELGDMHFRESRNLEYLQNIECPHIVGYIKYLVLNGRMLLVLENCRGRTLLEHFSLKHEARKYSEEDVKLRIRQILESLKCMHANERIHRDLKPANILIPEENQETLKICDFASMTGIRLDNSQYHSPKFGGPESCYTKDRTYYCCQATDMYAVGCIMYRSYMFKHPYEGKEITPDYATSEALLLRGLNTLLKESVIPISEDAFDLLKQLLEPYPEKRISAKEALKHKWFSEDHTFVKRTSELEKWA